MLVQSLLPELPRRHFLHPYTTTIAIRTPSPPRTQMGARQLRPVLMHLKREVTKAQQGQPGPPHPAQLNITSVAMLENFFALSWARFGQGWRPDVPPHLDRCVCMCVCEGGLSAIAYSLDLCFCAACSSCGACGSPFRIRVKA